MDNSTISNLITTKLSAKEVSAYSASSNCMVLKRNAELRFSNPLGALGYAACVEELMNQLNTTGLALYLLALPVLMPVC